MEILNLIDTFSEFKEFKNIDREAMMHIIEDVFKAMLAKKYGSDEYFNIIVNIDKGVLEVYHNRIVVEDGEVEDPLSDWILSGKADCSRILLRAMDEEIKLTVEQEAFSLV